MKSLLIATLIFCNAAFADVYMGELKKSKCTLLKGKDFMVYVKAALGDNKLEVTYDKAGACGQSVYIMKKTSRKRWAAFPDDTGCQCYLKTLKALDTAK